MLCSSKAAMIPTWRPKAALVVLAATLACATRCNSLAFSSHHKLPNKEPHVTFRRSDHLASRVPHATASHRGSRQRLGGRMGFSDETKTKPYPLKTDAYDEYSKNSGNNNSSDLSRSSSFSPAFVALNEKIRAFLLVAVLVLSFFVGPQNASAATSGGRMGGSFGGSDSSSSSKSSSAPSGSYSRGYNQGGYSRPNVIVSPVISPMYRPWYSPFGGPFTPFGSPFGYSPFGSPFGSPSYYGSPTGVVVSSGPPCVGIFFFAAVILLAINTFSNVGSNAMDSIGSSADSLLGPGVTVAEISVAIDVPDRDRSDSILSVLKRLSRTARTDSRTGLQNLTSQVALEILRRQTSIVAAFTKSSHYKDETKAQRDYNGISFVERGKFSKETVSKYGGVDYSDARKEEALTSRKYPSSATVAVVTVIVLIDGNTTKLPTIKSISDVKDALGRIAADVKVGDCLRSAEILWTPEERDDTLTMRDVFADYSSLRSI